MITKLEDFLKENKKVNENTEPVQDGVNTYTVTAKFKIQSTIGGTEDVKSYIFDEILKQHENIFDSTVEVEKIIVDETTTNEIFGLSGSDRKKKLEDKLKSSLLSWVPKKSIINPSEEILAKFWKDAEANKFQGTIGIDKEKQLFYKTDDQTNWGTTGHSFGGGA